MPTLLTKYFSQLSGEQTAFEASPGADLRLAGGCGIGWRETWMKSTFFICLGLATFVLLA